MTILTVIVHAATCFVALVGTFEAQTSPAHKLTNPNRGLVGKLCQQLNVTPEQAAGGAGAIFALAKSRLNPADFSKVAPAVPGMVDS